MTTDSTTDEAASLLKFLYACPVGLLEMDAEGTIGMMNPLAMQLLMPLAHGGAVFNLFSVMERWAPELRNLTQTFPKRQGRVCEGHRIIITPGTRENDYTARVLACTLVKLDANRFATTLVDVSAEVARERRLKQAEAWFASLLDDINDFAVLSLNAQGHIEHVNTSTTRQTGYPAADLVGQTPECLELTEAGSAVITVEEQLACAARDGWSLSEGWQRRRNGESYWCQRLLAVRNDVEHEHGRTVLGFLMILRDISHRHADAGHIVDLLRKDHLTGVANRSHFFTVAERECTRAHQTGQPLALIAIDIDHFKRINDTYGHATGDEVLKTFAELIRSVLRPSDTLARLGGEEFCVLLPGTTLSEAVTTAERLRERLALNSVWPHDLRVTASFGCAERTSIEGNCTDLLAIADRALYTAKRAGRDRTEPALAALTFPAEQACLG